MHWPILQNFQKILQIAGWSFTEVTDILKYPQILKRFLPTITLNAF